MKKLMLSICFINVFLIGNTQNIIGNWKGSLTINGGQFPIIFHIDKDSVGKYKASFDSPKQMSYNLACNEVFFQNDSIHIDIKLIRANYAGIYYKSTATFVGNWNQSNMSMPLTFVKISDTPSVTVIRRPQTPKLPYAYRSNDYIYYNSDSSIRFGATLTLPDSLKFPTQKGYPSVILISGSGQHDRDGMMFQHKPFAIIADYLTQRGIAVLRVDDRGKGKTTGNFSKSTTADFAIDVEAGIRFLQQQPGIDTTKIGLLGHSEGGIIAPMVASKRNDIAFLVLLAAPAVSIPELMSKQNRDILISTGRTVKEAESYQDLYKEIIKVLVSESDTAIIRKRTVLAFNQWQKTVDSNTVILLTAVTDKISKHNFLTQFIQLNQQIWYNYFFRINPSLYLKNVHCPVLALNGDKDIQVDATSNLAAIKQYIKASKKQVVETIALPQLNHLFQKCTTCTTDEYNELEESFNEGALKIISDWINKEIQLKNK
ncbi:MAG: alpha/beta hydrolase family protein [Ferruginibacter sp.]